MIIRSLVNVGQVCRQHLRAQQQICARTIFTTLTKRDQSQSSDDKLIWIEDNLKLDIKDSEKVTHIDAVPVSTGREARLIQTSPSTACALCRLNLKNLDYTDVMILSQFIKRNGSVVTYHESKLCTKQYFRVLNLIKKAQRCNLIQRPSDYLVPGPWHDLNTYIEIDRKRDQPMKIVKKEYWKI